MNIGISLTGNKKASAISAKFARCEFFAIYDSAEGSVTFIKNPNKLLKENAGHATVALLNKYNVKKVIAGEFGEKVKAEMNELKIQMIIIQDANRTLEQIIRLFEKQKDIK